MVMSGLICGSSSLPREEDEFYRQTRSADSSPRRHCRLSSKPNKNPYSSRGLDKFSALLAEIEEKRQKIYTQLGPDEISIVRFRYYPDHNIKPIVVKVKPLTKPKPNPENQSPNKTEEPAVPSRRTLTKMPSLPSMAVEKEEHKCGKACTQLCEKVKGYHWNEPKLYLPVVLMLILVCLVFFGRAFVIMCTSVGWYVIPTITNQEASPSYLKRTVKKKDHAVGRPSNKKLLVRQKAVSFKL